MQEFETINLFKKYCRAISDKPEIWGRMREELPAAILIDADRLLETTPTENERILNELAEKYATTKPKSSKI